MEKKYGLRCPNVFHAGDGNLHPLILFDANDPDQLERTERFAGEVLEKCVEVGGTITGEHGVGVEKIDQMCVQFAPAEIERFQGVKRAFDSGGLLNPGKNIPTLHRCAGRPHACWRAAAASEPEVLGVHLGKRVQARSFFPPLWAAARGPPRGARDSDEIRSTRDLDARGESGVIHLNTRRAAGGRLTTWRRAAQPRNADHAGIFRAWATTDWGCTADCDRRAEDLHLGGRCA
jgi:hypothetical protein